MNHAPVPCVRLDAWFEGHVQGVGFRYHVCKIAREFEVVGFVENLDDGRVHLTAEGAPKETEAFLDEIRRELSPFIKKDYSDSHPIEKPACKGFALR